jgi:hypothetical protein
VSNSLPWSAVWRVTAICGYAILMAGCPHPTPKPSYYSALASVTSYDVKTPKVTPAGIRYGGDLDPQALDRVTKQVAQCLATVPEPTQQERMEMDCLPAAIRRDVDPQAFNVFEAPDSHVNCRGEQTFPCRIDQKHCISKGIEAGSLKECPCECRATIQGGRTVVTAPNLRLYAAELTRLVTACLNPWVGPLRACAAIYP